MAYACYHYNNLEELKSALPNIANEVENYFDKDLLGNNSLLLYPTLADYANYELQDGQFKTNPGAAYSKINLAEYFNIVKLSNDLMKYWEPASHHLTNSGRVIVINFD